jgi:nucleoside-diphosphate-sugar epimerase
VLALEKASAGSVFHAATESGITEREIAQAISLAASCKAEGISLEQANLKWGHGIAAFFSISSQISASKAIQQLGWNPQATLSFIQDIELSANPLSNPIK